MPMDPWDLNPPGLGMWLHRRVLVSPRHEPGGGCQQRKVVPAGFSMRMDLVVGGADTGVSIKSLQFQVEGLTEERGRTLTRPGQAVPGKLQREERQERK